MMALDKAIEVACTTLVTPSAAAPAALSQQSEQTKHCRRLPCKARIPAVTKAAVTRCRMYCIVLIESIPSCAPICEGLGIDAADGGKYNSICTSCGEQRDVHQTVQCIHQTLKSETEAYSGA